jgi:ribonucleoside-diphosphate reductase alpha chain
MSATTISEEYLMEKNGESVVVIERKIGDFVVCNLASLNLGTCVRDGVVSRVTKIAMRMLDNVIDINNLPLVQADVTNKRYRPVGLGTFGWHHALAVSGVDWDSEESVKFADELYEEIAYNAISTSVEIGAEKGSYPYFENSDYNNGRYFDLRGYNTENSKYDWDDLKEKAKSHMRNGYWGAVAPNSSTGLIAGSTQGIDPFYDKSGMYIEEKKDFKIRVVAPDMSPETFSFYWKKGAYNVNQYTTIKQNEARQRHIDQAVSFNLYVPADVKAKDLFNLHRQIWKSKIKTSYYVHSKGNLVESDCEACQ